MKTNRPIATKAPSLTRVTATPKPTAKTGSSSSARGYEAEYGTVEVFTTSGKVNMRSGPGKGNKVVTQVEKRGTSLGQLLDAKADSKGVVWFKAKYKGKTGWITSDYAYAVAGTPQVKEVRDTHRSSRPGLMKLFTISLTRLRGCRKSVFSSRS